MKVALVTLAHIAVLRNNEDEIYHNWDGVNAVNRACWCDDLVRSTLLTLKRKGLMLAGSGDPDHKQHPPL